MPSKLPDDYKSLVIQAWLNGEQRDKIAVDYGLAAGSVTNIVNEWRAALGFPTADALRELAVTLRRIGITAAQCALGFRTATLMLRIGVKEDSFESFILNVYNRCKDIGLSPQNIASHLADLLEFSKTVPLSKIPDYVKEKTNEKRKLQEKIEDLGVIIENLQDETSDVLSRRDKALQDEKMTVSELKWYTDLREQLRKYGTPVEDISKLVKVVNNVRDCGYDAGRVIKEFLELESLKTSRQHLQQDLQSLENKLTELRQVCGTLELRANMHADFLDKYDRLEKMGFGLKELQSLWNTLYEIAQDNNIPTREAITKFLSDIERHYNNKLGLEAKVESLRNEVNELYKNETRLRTELLLLPLVGPKLVKLTQSGVSEQDIINIATVFEKYVAGKDSESFVSELEHYGGLKSVIQELSKQADKMRMELGSLQTQNRDLNAHNQRIISSLVNSTYTLDFMQGYINSLYSISAYITCSIGLQFGYLEKLKSDNGGEFTSLSRAYKGEGTVSIQEIKKELVKAIEIMQSKLDVNDRLTDVLSDTRLALIG
jgi:DNA-binding transcriptional MerR regulator